MSYPNTDALLSSISNTVVASYTDIYEPLSLLHISAYRSSIVELSTYLKLSSTFNLDMALDAFAIDVLEHEFRFTVVYQIQSSVNNQCVRIVTKLYDGLALGSIQELFPGLNWAEREIWDLSGIFFINHPDLRRILTDYGFSGHPLRKDFPVSGFRETQYSDITKQVIYKDVELSQSLRVPAVTSV